MAGSVTRNEFTQLAVRVDLVEREVEGEKLVTRHILDQTRHNGDDLAAIKTRMDRLEHKFDGLERKVDGLDRKVDGLTRDLPTIVADVMRRDSSRARRKRPELSGSLRAP